jgi:uncharacterized protein YkwD
VQAQYQTRRNRTVAVLVAVLAFAGPTRVIAANRYAPTSTTPLVASPGVRSTEERDFVEAVNRARALVGARALVWDPEIEPFTDESTLRMARQGWISHSPDFSRRVPGTWFMAGENVGIGDAVAQIEEAFEASPTHYANIVNPRFDTIAVSVARVGEAMFVTQHFVERRVDSRVQQRRS